MSNDVKELERRALELMKQADFGPEAVRVNTQIVEHDPTRQSAWTRLGRCYLEQRNFDEAVTALRAALTLNPTNGVATNLLAEARRRRALTPTATARGTTGFSIREFTMLETLSPDEAARALQPRFSALFDTINATAIAARIVESRQRQGESGFRASSTRTASRPPSPATSSRFTTAVAGNLSSTSAGTGLRRMPRARSGLALASISRSPAAIPIVPRARSVFSRSTIGSNRRSRNHGNASWHNGWGRTPDSFSIPTIRPRSTFCRSEPSSGF